MKKLMRVALAAACLLALAGGAGAAGARTDSGEYNTLVVKTGDPGSVTAGSLSNGVIFEVKPGERFVTLSIADDHSPEVRAMVLQDYDGDGSADLRREFCTRTDRPIRVKPGELGVWAQEGPCADGTPAAATLGKVTATFTK